ncbi:MAG: endonuclease/exonuclease/phosphatase family protein, partial [Leptospiraceae bacterium]|nr:endonuclease/exonuclease/phosphatase family protein [Leptospiraceae bacterium]
MKFYCLNCNGLRSATSKGLLESIQKENPDIIAFQEIKALQADIDLKPWEDLGYIPHFFSAEKKGYSGTAIFSRIKPKKVEIGMQHELYDKEGRNILLAFKNFAFVNTYFPSGTTGDIRQE